MLLNVLALAAFLLVTPAQAAERAGSGLAIAAVVGDEAITSYDVDARMRFVIATTKLTNNPETLQRLRPQVIRALVDERLQIKEAAANNISIDDGEVNRAVASIEKQRNMPEGAIFKMLAQSRVPKETFTSQIRAQIAWNKLLMKKIRPQIKISDEEVALAQKRLAIPEVKQELEIALLTLPIDKPKRESEVRSLAEKLSGEMRAGASFEELSRQFSSRSANAGGKVETFWVRPEQLEPVVARALASAKVGSITSPLRTPDGFTIVKVYNARALAGAGDTKTEEQVEIKDILLKLKSSAGDKEAEVLLSIGEQVAKNPGTCEEKGVAGISDLKDVDIEVNMRSERMSELTAAERTIVQSLKVGQISAPFASEEGIQLFMLCGRGTAPSKSLDVERVKGVIYQQKMALEAQKYMRNLHRDAYVEVR